MIDLNALILMVGCFNTMSAKNISEWPEIDNWESLNEQAKKLSYEEAEIFVDGEDTEMQAIMKKHGIQELHEFLDRIFDGDLNEAFYL